MSNPREIQVLNSTEFWRDYLGFGLEAGPDDDLIPTAISAVHHAIEDLGHTTTTPQGSRTLLSVWRGARWAHEFGGVATVEKFTTDEWQTVCEAVDAALSAFRAQLVDTQADPRHAILALRETWDGQESLASAISRVYNVPEANVDVDNFGDVWIGRWLDDDDLVALPARLADLGYLL